MTESSYLDLLSTSQTKTSVFRGFEKSCASPKCEYYAPYFAYQKGEKYYAVCQGCCNHWDCARCGILRAKAEYGRMVVGAEHLAEKHTLYFITITCRGRDLSLNEAERNYLLWTNRFLSACRIKAKREEQDWYYVQVTEKQKRGHPHSHILTTFTPGDLYLGWKENWKKRNGLLVNEWQACYRSEWLHSSVLSAGLGEQYDISVVRTAAAASRYVAKYMFKDSIFGTHWPKGWKRIRYSRNFPQLPEKPTDAFVLLAWNDWHKLASLAAIITTDSAQTKGEVLRQLAGHDILVS